MTKVKSGWDHLDSDRVLVCLCLLIQTLYIFSFCIVPEPPNFSLPVGQTEPKVPGPIKKHNAIKLISSSEIEFEAMNAS